MRGPYGTIIGLGFSSSDRNKLYLVYSYSLKILITFLIFCELWYFFTISWDLDRVIDSVNIIIIQFSAMYKYMKLIGQRELFKRLASSMESPYFDISTSEREKLLDVWQKRNEAYLRLLLGLGTGTLMAWYDNPLIPIVEKSRSISTIYHVAPVYTYPLVDDLDYNLMVAIRLPFEYCTPFRYFLTYTAVLVVFSYIAYFVMVNDLIIQAHVMHLLCQFAVLNDCFRNLLRDSCEKNEDLHLQSYSLLFVTDEFKQRYIKKLDNLIKQHQWILSNVLTLRAILSGPMLAQLAVSTTLISSIGYQVAMNTENYTKCLMSLFYLGYNMSVLYIICRWCEEVKTQSEYIAEAVYCSGWESGAAALPGVRARLLLLIARANKPLVLTAGGMYELSLASYSSMIKTSYSALTVLLRLRQEPD